MSHWKDYYKKNADRAVEKAKAWKKKHKERANLTAKKSKRKIKQQERQEINRLFNYILINTRRYLDNIDETKLTAEDRVYLQNNSFSMS